MKLAVLFFSQKYVQICDLLSSQHDIWLVEEVPKIWEEYKELYHYKCITVEELLCLYKEKKIEKVIVMPVMRKTLNHFIKKLVQNGIEEEDILYLPSRKSKKPCKTASQIYNDMCLFKERKELDYLAIHVYDGCNFKCSHCSMLEGAATSYKKISLRKTEKSLGKLNKMFNEIGLIQIIGGEPLLNEKLNDYLTMIRKYYANSEIQILTNGSLLLEQKDVFFQKIRKEHITLVISRYPQLDLIIEDINKLLKTKKVSYYFTDRIGKFSKYYDFMQEADIDLVFNICQSMQYCKNGLNLRENLIAPCCVPFALEHMSERFGMDGSFCTVMNLEDIVLPKDITGMLEESHPMCKVCHLDGFAEWRQVKPGEKSDIKNWSVSAREKR